MTVQTTKNIIVHVATDGQDTYSYDFLVLSADHMYVYLDGIPYAGGYQVTGIGNQDGGSVVLDDPIGPADDGKQLSLVRLLEATQELDYTTYDGFPAESHERGLDKLTMLVQQADNVLLNAIRIPEIEDSDEVNTVVPFALDRAEKFLYFDVDGNVTALEAELNVPAVYRIDVQDGSNGHDSRQLLHVETVSGGANYPKIGFHNVNQPLGPVQLDSQGKIPEDLLNITGITIRGPFRGDDLCDKPGDEPGECTPPDTRNPSERWPDLADAFSNGDTFLISIEEPQINGTMNLYENINDATPSIVTVTKRDAIIYLDEFEDPNSPGDILIQEGWHFIPKMVETGDASFIIYDDTDNIYVLGGNVQLALDAVDDHLVIRDSWYMTQRSSIREAIEVSDANAVIPSGFYHAAEGSANFPSASSFYMFQISEDGDNHAQVAISRSSGFVYTRGRELGAWTDWVRSAVEDEIVTLTDALDALTLVVDGKKDEQDFLRTGDRLDIYNVRVP